MPKANIDAARFLTAQSELVESVGDLAIRRVQVLDDAWLERMKAEHLGAAPASKSELRRFASIPVAIYERWLREGFNPRHATPKEIVARMKSAGLDYFTAGKV